MPAVRRLATVLNNRRPMTNAIAHDVNHSRPLHKKYNVSGIRLACCLYENGLGEGSIRISNDRVLFNNAPRWECGTIVLRDSPLVVWGDDVVAAAYCSYDR